MRYSAGACILLATLASPLWAANLRIVGCDVVWSTASPSPVYHVLIVNEQGATDRLAGWQLRLTILPTDGATGILQFASADLPRDPADDYLLAGDSATIDGPDPPPAPLVPGPTDTLLLADYALSVFGNPVPSSARTLLKTRFTASESVQGVFAVAAIPGVENSLWASFDTTDFPTEARGFQNVPVEGGTSIILGYVTVNVSVPEPSGMPLQLAGLASVIGCLTGRTRGEKRR